MNRQPNKVCKLCNTKVNKFSRESDGFGYSLQRGLLYDLAKYGTGGTGHIPDGGMIATVFCNFIGTIMTTVAVNLQLNINYSKEIDFNKNPPIMGDFVYNITDKSDKFVANSTSGTAISINLGNVQLGQMRNIIMNTDLFDSDDLFSYYYTYKIGGQLYRSEEVVDLDVSQQPMNNSIVNIHVAKNFVVETLRKIINLKQQNNSSEALQCFTELKDYYISRSGELVDPLSLGILENINDQINLAITNNTYYNRWGEFYIDMISDAINKQIKPNFKDMGCPFGGDVFTDIVDWASDAFDSLPPPEPSNVRNSSYTNSGGYSSTYTAPSQPINMAVYNTMSGPCFHGDSTVSMANGSVKAIKDLQKGDLVSTLSNVYDSSSPVVEASVVCVLQTNIIGGKTELVTLDNGLKVTPWHPIYIYGAWNYPSKISPICCEECNSVYTIILDSFHTCMINSIWCITLGHGYTRDILNHEYFGTGAIITDLIKFTGWDDGRVIINNTNIVRDHISGKVIGIRNSNCDARSEYSYAQFG